MSTEAPAKPAAATPPPTAPVAPAAPAVVPATPPIPAAQAASVRNQPANKTATTSSRTPPESPPTLDHEMRKLAEEHFKPKPKPGEAPVTPPVAAAPETAAKETSAEAPKAKDATPPVAAAPTEKEPLDIPEPKGMTPENLANWKTWREQAKKEINEAKNEKAALAAKLKTYETATPADTEKAARLEAQLKEAQDKLAVHDLSSHPDFVRQFVEPKKNALKEAAEIVAYNGKEGVNLAAVLDKPLKEFNAAVSELTKDMNGMDATSVQTALRNAYKLAGDEKTQLANASQMKAQLEAKAAQAARSAFERTRDEIKQKIPTLQVPEGASPETVAEFEDYNQSVAAALAEAESNSFSKITEADVARIAHESAMLKPMSKLFRSVETKYKSVLQLNRELSAELAAIKKGKSPGQFTETGAATKPDTSKMDLKQLAEHMIAGKTP